MKLKNATLRVIRKFYIPEEKRTDVNIAIHMLYDSIYSECQRMVVVSGDSDLVPVLQMIKKNSPEKEIIAYIPADNEIRGAAVEMRGVADKDRTLPLALLSKAQFPQEVPDGKGGYVLRPDSW